MRPRTPTTRPAWATPQKYNLGDKVSWCGIDLVCTVGHHAGVEALHPWDPGSHFPLQKQASLWSPNGLAQRDQLLDVLAGPMPEHAVRGEADAERLAQVLKAAIGVQS